MAIEHEALRHLSRLLFTGLLVVAGCRPTAPVPAPTTTSEATAAQSALRVLVLDDPELAREIQRQWIAHGEQPLTIRESTVKAVLESPARRLAADVVICPSAFLGEVAGRDLLQPLDDSILNDARFQLREIWEAIRLNEMKWGTATLAVPLGSPPLLLAYRQDLFDQFDLSPPVTWSDYQVLVERFASSPSTKGQSSTPGDWTGTVEPIGRGWLAELFLARAASYARHPSQFSTLFEYSSMRPLINGPPFLKALEELLAANVAKSPSPEFWQQARDERTPEFAANQLLEGRCAMAITWLASREKGSSDKENTSPPFPVAFAPLPRSPESFNFRTGAWEAHSIDAVGVPFLGASGRLASMTKECRGRAEAARLLQFLSGPELSAQISSASSSTTLFRESHLAQGDKWLKGQVDSETAGNYSRTLQQVLNQSVCLITLRIPGRERYMNALDHAIDDAATGKKTPQAALDDVAKQWDAITDELGRDTQQKAYVRSIGLE